MPRATTWAALAVALALAGCMGVGTMEEAGSTEVARHATLRVTNEDAGMADLRYESLLAGKVVDRRHYRLGGNDSAELTLGYPAQGNTVLRVTHQGTGKAWEVTIAAGSCATVVADVVIVDGVPHSRDFHCSAN